MMRRWLPLALAALLPLPAAAQAGGTETDQTIRAMQDEMARSMARLQTATLGRPYFIAYRLLDVELRTVTAEFGALVNSSTTHNRFMVVEVRMGNYHIDSSNFITSGGFQGSLGSAGQVGIDGDYNSLRQDLWLATDQAYKQAADQLARKQAFLNSLARPPEIDDFSRIERPVVLVQPRARPDWTNRDWEQEAREASAVFRQFPELATGRVTYTLLYSTYYLLTSEGTLLRVPRSLAAIEASVDTQAPDGMPLHDFLTAYARRPSELPPLAEIRAACQKLGQELVALRSSPPVSDYEGPVLFEPEAAASLLLQVLGPSLSGARPPLSTVSMFDQMLEQLGARNQWTGRLGQRVLDPSLTLVDDPTLDSFQNQPLLGSYPVDEEGVPAQRVLLVENGLLKSFLMSRRPGPDLSQSNGHGRAADLGTPVPTIGNLFLQSSAALDPAALRAKFLDLCRANHLPWCLVVRRMDNPALAATARQDFEEMLSGIVTGVANGDRLPVVVARIWSSDGHEELVRGARLTGLTSRALRSIAAAGSDDRVIHLMLNPSFLGTALAPFGSAASGLPASVVAPSLLLDDVDVRGPHGGEQRPPLLPPPPLQP